MLEGTRAVIILFRVLAVCALINTLTIPLYVLSGRQDYLAVILKRGSQEHKMPLARFAHGQFYFNAPASEALASRRNKNAPPAIAGKAFYVLSGRQDDNHLPQTLLYQ